MYVPLAKLQEMKRKDKIIEDLSTEKQDLKDRLSNLQKKYSEMDRSLYAKELVMKKYQVAVVKLNKIAKLKDVKNSRSTLVKVDNLHKTSVETISTKRGEKSKRKC